MNYSKEELHILLHEIYLDNRKSFTKFFDLLYRSILQFASYFVKNSELCHEIVSEVFIIIWNNRKSLPEIQNFEAYLYTITKNEALRILKKQKLSKNEPFDNNSLKIRIESDTPESEMISKELVEIVQNAINELPEKCKLIFLMVREQGLKYRQIAELLDIGEGTVHTQMHIAISRISSIVSRHDKSFKL